MRFVVAAIALALVACTPRVHTDRARGSAPITPSAVRVRGVAVQRARVEPSAALFGRLEPYERAALAVRFAGVVTDVRVDLGDRVRRGQALAAVGVPGLDAQAEVALAADESARRETELRSDAARRVSAIAEQNRAAVAEQEIVSARGAVAAAQSHVAATAAEVRRVRALLNDTHLTAPFDGVVVSRRKDRGASVMAGEVLLEIARVDRLRLRLAVPEAQAGFVRLGGPVGVTLPTLGGRQLAVLIDRFAPALDPMTRMLTVESDVPNADGSILAGVRVEARLANQAREHALVAPSEAVLSEGTLSVAFVAAGGVARRRVLRIGYDNGVSAEVLEGLAEGDVVLLGGRGLLREGVPVEVAR